MSLRRQSLEALGLEDKVINEIIAAHTETVTAIKDERDKLKEQLAASEKLKSDLEALQGKLKTDYVSKSEYDKVKKEYDDYKADISAKDVKTAKEKAVKEYFGSKGIKGDNLDIAMMTIESRMGEFELDGENLKDTKSLDDLVSGKLAKLVTKTEEIGAHVPTPPQNNGGTKPQSKGAELEKAYHANLYGEAPKTNPKGE